MEGPLILHIETSSELCSVSIARAGAAVSYHSGNGRRDHAAQLSPLISVTMEDAEISMQELSAVAISAGPGSYTGLRIGTSTAKGICHALDIPLIAINTLEILATGMLHADTHGAEYFCPLIDARRMEVYMAVLDRSLQMVTAPQAFVIEDALSTGLPDDARICFGGSGLQKSIPYLKNKHSFLSPVLLPDARMMHAAAYAAWQSGAFADTAYFEPDYLKEFYTPQPKKKNLI